MTSPDHQSGTDRIVEVIEHYPHRIVVNIQGDEPLLNPKSVETIIEALASDPDAAVGTAAFSIHSLKELDDPNVVKVVVSQNQRALMFTRAAAPHVRDQAARSEWINLKIHYRHLGVYVYRRDALLTYAQWKPGPLELAEKLEQLRFLEHGAVVACPLVENGSPGVDTPEDLVDIEQLLAR
jgi:3-deoxy-manno-octulosonate cytidylyltransferase (CMP-KDO synthetase)